MRCLKNLVFAALVAAAGCGGAKSPSPVSPSTSGTAATVTISAASPHSASIHPNETVQFVALATFSDGTTGDCTDASTWTSSDERVLKSGSKSGQFIGQTAGTVKISAWCGPVSAALDLTVPSAVRVSVAGPQGHTATFTSGEQSHLFATVAFSDGLSDDCSQTGTWSTDNPGVTRLDPNAGGAFQALASGTATLAAACLGLRGTMSVTVGPGVRITGLESYPYFVLNEKAIPVRALLVDDRGATVRDCTAEAAWSTTNFHGGWVDPHPLGGQGPSFSPGSAGNEAIITATCGASRGQLRVRTDRYALGGTVRSTAGEVLAGAHVFGSDNRWGSIPSDGSGRYSLLESYEGGGVVVSMAGFETVVSAITWDRQPSMTRDIVMQPLAGVFQRGENPDGSTPDVITFTAPRTGTLRFTSQWEAPNGSGIDHAIELILTCNGAQVLDVYDYDGRGKGFTTPANTACHYQLRISSDTFGGGPVRPFQWTLNIQ